MATGTVQMPEVHGGDITTTFDGLFDYPNGMYILTTSSSDTKRPANYNTWMVIQFTLDASDFHYVLQLAMNTSSYMYMYMRKRIKQGGSAVITDWKSVTFA